MKHLRKKIILLLTFFVGWIGIFALQKPLFLLAYKGNLHDVLAVWWHGLPLDMSVAGYFTVVPSLLLLITSLPYKQLCKGRRKQVIKVIYRSWIVLSALAVALSFVANYALYAYWQFPLDATPLFFISSSPKDAMASVQWWQALLALCAVMSVTYAIYKLFQLLAKYFTTSIYHSLKVWQWIVLALLVATLFLPIRGGVSVSTMNTGKVYFSDEQILNHAAVNPLFSLMESMAHQENFAEMYHFMDNAVAQRLTQRLLQPKHTLTNTISANLTVAKPDIYLLILESFSDTLTTQRGVTPCINQLKKQGLYFTNCYANSYRTDRGLLSILYGYPSPATVSLMKYPHKTATLTSMPQLLKNAGWNLKYYYGGDANFTNMRSFLHNQGFQDIIEDVNFPIAARMSKWGVPDHLLFEKVKKDITVDKHTKPLLRVIQTSSSHEPFDVPYRKFADKALNAFAYADSCVGNFIAYLKQSKRWNKSLVILVPDHLGAWPNDISNYVPTRFHIPLIFTGGAIRQPRIIDTYASQQDIAATLLTMLGINHQKMKFSKDILNQHIPHYAYFMMNDGFGLVDEHTAVIYDFKRNKVVYQQGNLTKQYLQVGKAYIQTIFNDIASR